MYYMCNKCLEIYEDEKGIFNNIEYCVKSGCSSPIFQIDEEMIPIILNFRELGIRTLFCCSCHYSSDIKNLLFKNIYVLFKDTYEFNIPLPKGFKIEYSQYGNMRRTYIGYNMADPEHRRIEPEGYNLNKYSLERFNILSEFIKWQMKILKDPINNMKLNNDIIIPDREIYIKHNGVIMSKECLSLENTRKQKEEINKQKK